MPSGHSQPSVRTLQTYRVGLLNYADDSDDAGLNGREATTKVEVEQILNETNFAAETLTISLAVVGVCTNQEKKMSRSARPQLAPPPPRRRLHRLQATPVVRCAESSCTSPSAAPCRGWRPRAAITTLRAWHNNMCADWCTSPQPKSSGSTQSFTFKSSGSTHPFNFKSSGSTHAFRPSCLQALVLSGPRAFFRPWRAPWSLMPSGPRLLQVMISSL